MAEQSGQSIAALQSRLSALAHRHGAIGEADRRFADAVSSAHAITVQALAALDRIETEIEATVAEQQQRSIDTPAGARDLQRYLLDKQREIQAVVTAAHDQAARKTAVIQEILDTYRS